MEIDDLNEFGFIHSHNIKLNINGFPEFITLHETKDCASIYLWLSPLDESTFEVLYIGKAGYGLKRRFQQHAGGFSNSPTGNKNRELITSKIQSGREIHVYSRESAEANMFGVDISLYSTEEEAMCKAFSPLWNRASFPKTKNKETSPIPLVEKQADDASLSNEHSVPLNTIDFSQLNDSSEANAYFENLTPEAKSKFTQLFNYVQSVGEFSQLPQKIVHGYENQPTQPQNYNKVPMLLFARIGRKGTALPNQWAVRIPLCDNNLTLIFPDRFLVNDIDEALIYRGKGNNFCPVNIDDFLAHPERYITVL